MDLTQRPQLRLLTDRERLQEAINALNLPLLREYHKGVTPEREKAIMAQIDHHMAVLRQFDITSQTEEV